MTEVQQGIESITVEATVIRKDGSREDVGTVAHWHATEDDLAISTYFGLIKRTLEVK